VQRLDIVQTDQSGALDDLAGITLQIAAATFIVEKRQSPWSTLLVDEPTASCDRTNRRALAIELARLLSAGTGFRQALVLSHSPDVAEVFPNVIEIVVKRDGTRAITAT
jgi:DNA repair exonuclease SbcCD ATPase subunit